MAEQVDEVITSDTAVSPQEVDSQEKEVDRNSPQKDRQSPRRVMDLPTALSLTGNVTGFVKSNMDPTVRSKKEVEQRNKLEEQRAKERARKQKAAIQSAQTPAQGTKPRKKGSKDCCKCTIS